MLSAAILVDRARGYRVDMTDYKRNCGYPSGAVAGRSDHGVKSGLVGSVTHLSVATLLFCLVAFQGVFLGNLFHVTALQSSTSTISSATTSPSLSDLGFKLVFQSFNGNGRAFSTALDETYYLDTVTTEDPDSCLVACNELEECAGVFVRLEGDGVVCFLLSDLGSPEGIPTEIDSASVRKMLPTTTFTPRTTTTTTSTTTTTTSTSTSSTASNRTTTQTPSLEDLGFTVIFDAFQGSGLRFSTALDPESQIDIQIVSEMDECLEACYNNGECLGIYITFKVNISCYLLSNL
eukprot:gene1557-4705_t